MRKLITTGLLCMLAVISASTLAEAGQAEDCLWSTAVKITCDRSVPVGAATGFSLCEDGRVGATCAPVPDGTLTCGTKNSVRSTGLRVCSNFKPTTFKFLIGLQDESGNSICSESVAGMEIGNTAICGDFRSPKLSVGRPH
jgi:hypothetical protein